MKNQYVCMCLMPYTLLDVLQKEGGSSQVVNGTLKEALDLLLVEVHGNDVCQAGLVCGEVQ